MRKINRIHIATLQQGHNQSKETSSIFLGLMIAKLEKTLRTTQRNVIKVQDWAC